MKIQGPNSLINLYKNNQGKSVAKQQKQTLKDKLNISVEAKTLQKNEKAVLEREQYVNDIKLRVQNGEYKINYEETANKMIDFWSNRN